MLQSPFFVGGKQNRKAVSTASDFCLQLKHFESLKSQLKIREALVQYLKSTKLINILWKKNEKKTKKKRKKNFKKNQKN